MRLRPILALLALGLAAAPALADSAATQPSPAATQVAILRSEIKANELFTKGKYPEALAIYRRVEPLLVDQPDQEALVLDKIGMCLRQIDNPTTQPAAPAQSVVQAVDGGVRKIHPAPASGQVVNCPIKELGNFDYDAETGGGIPTDVQRLDGATFRTSGFMIPMDEAESISKFALVPSLFSCCFGQPPQVQHTIIVQTPAGKSVAYMPDELIVQGTLHVKEERDGGYITDIFQMDATSVEMAPK